MNKQNVIKKSFLAVLCSLLTIILFTQPVFAISNWENDYFAHGAGLSDSQLEETERLIGIPQDEELKNIIVTGADYEQFTGRAIDDANLYSSAIISKTEAGSGVHVYINTPENITEIKDHQFMNAALTSGITDVNIVVGSPIPVTGESALIGVYKALEDAGYEINQEATKTATDELVVVNEINQNNKDNADFNSEEFSKAIAEIKKQIADNSDKGSLDTDQINIIINNVFNQYNINISDADKAKLASWLEEFKQLDIDWGLIANELSGVGDFISKRGGEIYEWGQESGFFAKIWQIIKDFFDSLFG